MRGKQRILDQLCADKRITPADAGKTLASASRSAAAQDHPRGCGENLSALFLMTACTGSPPRMRGKPLSASTHHRVYRITPADAGKTEGADLRLVRATDHPRGCGENSLNGISLATGLGSPPRMRGKPELKNTPNGVPGITPADAGKTIKPCQSRALERDHPRGCGENWSSRRVQIFR